MNKTIDEYLKQPQKDLVIYDCEDCGKHIEKSGKIFRRNPHLKCKACYMKSIYGVTTNIARPEVKEKTQDNIKNKYGSKEAFDKLRIKNSKEALIKKYNVENNFSREDVKIKIKEKKNYIQEAEKRKNTNIERYGTPMIGKNTHIYKGIHFDSSWELAFWIWCEDHNKKIERNLNPIISKTKQKYYPDFIVDGRLYEIKGDFLTKYEGYEDKLETFIKYDVKVIMQKDIVPILHYIYSKYGKEYLKKFKRKTEKSYKRKPTEEGQKPKRHHRIHYKCKACGVDVYATKRIYEHFNDGLCKYCRKTQVISTNCTN